MALIGIIGVRVRIASQQPLRRPVLNGSPHLTRSYHIPARATPLVQSSPLLSRPGRKPLARPIEYPALGAKRTFVISTDFSGAVETTQTLISHMHSLTGLPWYITIPLIALGLNLCTRWPITVYTQELHRRRPELTTILRAWKDTHAKIIQKYYPHLTPAKKDKLLNKRFKGTVKRLFRLYGVERWKDYLNLGILPVWLFVIEALRRLCGTSRGLLGTIILGREDTSSTTAPTSSSSSSTPPSLDDTLPSSTDISPALATGEVDPVTAAQNLQLINTLPSHGDPSLATGGCLWFPDLMVPDPYHILPGMLSVILVVNLLPQTKAGLLALVGAKSSKVAPESKGRLRLQRAFLLLSIAAGPLTANLPAAIHLYWVSSASIAMVMKKIADHRWPIPKVPVIEPCKGQKTVIQMPKREKSTSQ